MALEWPDDTAPADAPSPVASGDDLPADVPNGDIGPGEED